MSGGADVVVHPDRGRGEPVRMVELGRVVVVIVTAVVIALAAAVASVASYVAGADDPPEPVNVTLGTWDVLVQQSRPPNALILAALFAMLAIAAGAVALEGAAALRILRNPDRQLLELATPMLAYRAASGPVRVTVLVPAHNEELSLPATLEALLEQTRRPDRVVVVADNCTDRTVEIAREHGCEVFESVDNTDRKAGALNQALGRILPELGSSDAIMVMDADTRIGPRYLEAAARELDEDPDLEAVGGIFYGEDGVGLLGQFQRNEYTRYSGEIHRRRGRVFVLTGTASVFRADSLRAVAGAREICLPGEAGQVYDTAALTEDNELTIALKSLGSPMVSPRECTVTTEIMPTWGDLWRQRLRWQRGALENIAAYGITTATVRYWGQQVGIAYGAIALNSYLFLMIVTLLAFEEWVWFPFWLVVGSVFVAERVVTAWSGGWKARLLAVTVFPELVYDVFLQAVFARSLFDILVARRASWGHVQHAAPTQEAL